MILHFSVHCPLKTDSKVESVLFFIAKDVIIACAYGQVKILLIFKGMKPFATGRIIGLNISAFL